MNDLEKAMSYAQKRLQECTDEVAQLQRMLAERQAKVSYWQNEVQEIADDMSRADSA